MTLAQLLEYHDPDDPAYETIKNALGRLQSLSDTCDRIVRAANDLEHQANKQTSLARQAARNGNYLQVENCHGRSGAYRASVTAIHKALRSE